MKFRFLQTFLPKFCISACKQRRMRILMNVNKWPIFEQTPWQPLVRKRLRPILRALYWLTCYVLSQQRACNMGRSLVVTKVCHGVYVLDFCEGD